MERCPLFRPPEKDETFQQYFEGILGDPDQHLLFACLDDVEVGFVQYFLGLRPQSIFRPERRVGYVHGLVVNEEHRRTGCADMLIEYVKQVARQEVLPCWASISGRSTLRPEPVLKKPVSR